jgi:hypothetical protein
VYVATRRLIVASASLDPADRALLALWVNHGLEDAAVARMSGTSPAGISRRHRRLIKRLSDVLGLPPGDHGDHPVDLRLDLSLSIGPSGRAVPSRPGRPRRVPHS